MSARRAVSRLGKLQKAPAKTPGRIEERGAPFRPADRPHAQLPRWPADAFDDEPLEALRVPPHGEVQNVCIDWPECQCNGDCEDRLRTHGPADDINQVLFAFITLLAVIGSVAIWLGLR